MTLQKHMAIRSRAMLMTLTVGAGGAWSRLGFAYGQL